MSSQPAATQSRSAPAYLEDEANSDRRFVPCHLCAGQEHDIYLRARGYRIVRCRRCGLWFVNPQPTAAELQQFYEGYDDGSQWREGEERFNHAICAAILRRHRSGSVLDVGCGSGNFLRCMNQRGFRVLGLEPSATGSAYARSAHGLEIYQGTLEQFLGDHKGQLFDVITLLNVLEHLRDPAGALMQLRKLLGNGGTLAIVVPDARFHDVLGRVRQYFRIADPYWIEQTESRLSGFKLPDHLCSFEPSTLAALLHRCGFEMITLENAPVVLNPDWKRNFFKYLVHGAGQVVYHLTLRHFVIGYSTLALATRTDSPR